VSVVGWKSSSVLAAYCYTYANGTGLDTDLRLSVTNVSSSIAGCPTTGTASTTLYGYDTLNRLTEAQTVGKFWQYAYDVNGNMCAKYSGSSAISMSGCSTSGTGVTQYTVNNANELTNSGFGYDDAGNETADPGVFSSASYNTLEQMSSVTPTGGSALPMAYHGLGQVMRTDSGRDTLTYDQLGLEDAYAVEQDKAFFRDADGTILGETFDGNPYYFLFDGNGSVVAATDSSGTVDASFTYDPYGSLTNSTGSTGYEPIRFDGGYDDSANSGEQLLKFGERYYDPTTARWTTQDPISQPLNQHGWNQYEYAGDNPINSVDPSGMCGIGSLSDFGDCFSDAANFAKRHENAISCGLFAAGVVLGVGELYVGAREAGALLKGARAAERLKKSHLERVGAAGAASGASFALNVATGGCSAVGGL
jgi:RHS repeat-associated protein